MMNKKIKILIKQNMIFFLFNKDKKIRIIIKYFKEKIINRGKN